MTKRIDAPYEVREATVRYKRRGPKTPDKLTSPESVVALMRQVVKDESKECFAAILLDARHKPIAHVIVSLGTATASLVHPREVFQTALLSGACSIIVTHNHPSGDVSPSPEDRTVTQRLADAGKILGIQVLDHVIWSHHSDAHFSFRTHGDLT